MVNIHLIDNIVYLSQLLLKTVFLSFYLYHTAGLYHLKVQNNSIEKYTFILAYWLCIFYSVNIGIKYKRLLYLASLFFVKQIIMYK